MITKGLARIAAVAAATVSIALPLAGCAGSTAPTPPAPGVSAEEVARIKSMPPVTVREEIDPSFPIEVPVPAGVVVRGEAQGSEAWDYEMVVGASQAAVVEWYRQAFTGRSWSVVGERDVSIDGSAGTELTVRKGTAEFRVTVVQEGSGSRASAVLGVGAPVLETQ